MAEIAVEFMTAVIGALEPPDGLGRDAGPNHQYFKEELTNGYV